MTWRDGKYLLAYLIPLITFGALGAKGWWSYSTVIFAFGLVPILDLMLPASDENLDKEGRITQLQKRLFDWLLYLNVPLVFGTVGYFAWVIDQGDLATYELVGLILSVGIVLGSNGINVAHELGHRRAKHERRMAKMLLLPSLYMHFYVEHNQGHHKYVATDLDPASARSGQHVYHFWWRSTVGSYRQAWEIQLKNLKLKKYAFWSWKNEMLWYQGVQALYVLGLGICFNWDVALWVVLAGVVGFLLLETINYIEHYGLRRKKLPSGGYERVLPHHSWNANYEVGRIILYELTRHSDHHYIASKKYQILDHHHSAPELPVGYPAAMLLALTPPLWFAIMDKRLAQFQQQATFA